MDSVFGWCFTVSGVRDISLADYPLTLTCVCLATVAGFVSLLPGGLGVRELVMIPMLGARFGSVTAVVAAVIIRLVWLSAELLTSGIIYFYAKQRQNRRFVELMATLSVLIPVLNEADSLEELHAEISAVADQQNYELELIFVDDGSTDRSWGVDSSSWRRRTLVSRVCGFDGTLAKHRRYERLLRLPLLLYWSVWTRICKTIRVKFPDLLDKMGEDYDLVSGWKAVRQDPISKTLPSRIFNTLVGWLTGLKLHDHNCGFKVYRREIFDDVKLYGEMHRFIPVLAAARGYRVGEVAVKHRPRSHGKSKYGWSRLPKGFLDLLTVTFLAGFHQRPQHLLGSFGLFSFGLGALGMFWMAIYWVLG